MVTDLNLLNIADHSGEEPQPASQGSPNIGWCKKGGSKSRISFCLSPGCLSIEPKMRLSLLPEQIDVSPCHNCVTNSVEKRVNYGNGTERKKQGN